MIPLQPSVRTHPTSRGPQGELLLKAPGHERQPPLLIFLPSSRWESSPTFRRTERSSNGQSHSALSARQLEQAHQTVGETDTKSEPQIRERGQYVVGPTGTGKTWLACAFGHQAARLDHSVLYVRMPRLFEDMAMARLDGRFPKLVDKLARVQLLILDDWGTHGLTDQQRLDLLELFEERYQRRSTIITAQLPVSGWHDMIGEPTIADAILDRIVHNAHRIHLKGDSMRRKDQNVNLTTRENTETLHTET